eukprot:7387494-Prymnesium_polylepis.2
MMCAHDASGSARLRMHIAEEMAKGLLRLPHRPVVGASGGLAVDIARHRHSQRRWWRARRHAWERARQHCMRHVAREEPQIPRLRPDRQEGVLVPPRPRLELEQEGAAEQAHLGVRLAVVGGACARIHIVDRSPQGLAVVVERVEVARGVDVEPAAHAQRRSARPCHAKLGYGVSAVGRLSALAQHADGFEHHVVQPAIPLRRRATEALLR